MRQQGIGQLAQLLGIGLDEATAIIVTKSRAEVVGRGRVFFYDRRLPLHPDRPDYVALKAGSVYDLAGRRIATTDPNGRTTTYDHDLNGRQTTVTDQKPVDAVVMAIVDSWEIDGDVKYRKGDDE